MASEAKDRLKSLLKKLLYPASDRLPAARPKVWREWSIGIYEGNSPFHFVSPQNLANPVLTREHVTDVPALFVADPFMVRANECWYMYFEVWNQRTQKGEIGLATSVDRLAWTYKQIVLAETFHLSYPYVFQWNNECYMIPESLQANSIRLYRASNFPTEWSFVKTLIEGQEYVDSSPFYFNDRWWMLTSLGPPPYRAGSLLLYHADELTGRWKEHWKSPIIKSNVHSARLAGRPQVVGSRIVRYAQDCDGGYGLQVRAFEITKLTTWRYHERELNESPLLKGSGAGWNASGMHHIDPHLLDDGKWIACVDGQIALTT